MLGLALAGCSIGEDADEEPTAGRTERSFAPSEKPALYLYPREVTRLDVTLDYAGELTYTYPAVEQEGTKATWQVTATPAGELTDAAGREYPYLFWEGVNARSFTPTEGFVVEAGREVEFLEDKLAVLGLNQREAAEFITYWGAADRRARTLPGDVRR
ncbi:hypothetical protein [Actinomyces sp. MRS3W]|uniref:hypothetical protein n=1 Tax=Actinomyces sp. MRS3W TaxID=2800796 RepID=UPI0028FD108B|nr:hypothetical protein [Actinomyces sp. MRS3W]MDU0349669.1 hypothetical protein [Actinomyces sp. MRS3W]